MEIKIFKNGQTRKAVLSKGKIKKSVPKTYKEIDIVGHNIGSFWASNDYLTIYKNRTGKLIYKIYIKGSIFPNYGEIKFLD